MDLKTAPSVNGVLMPRLVPTAVKTANYTAVAADLVPCDTTSGSFTVTLPNAPADGARVAIKHVIQGSTNVVTYACGGSDVINKTGGVTSGTLPLLAQAVLLQYRVSGGIWYVIADDLALSQLDSRYAGYSTVNRIGSFVFAGHSWLVYGGSGGDEQGRRAEGVAGRFASMENISTTEVISMGRSGAQLFDDSAFPRAGWPAMSQLFVPPANLRRGITSATPPSAPYAAQPGGTFLLYGINDPIPDQIGLTTNRGVYRAYANALRSSIVARRSGGDFEYDHTSIVLSGFATAVTTAKSQGKGYKKSIANNDTFTITIPSDFPGGTLAVRLIGTNDISSVLGAAVDATQTKWAFGAFGFQTVPLTFPCLALCGTEQVSITAVNGSGTQTTALTVSTHGTTTVDGISPTITSASVGKMLYGHADIPNGATIVSQTGNACVISAAAVGTHTGISVTAAICHTVTRGVNSTTAATHASNAQVNSAAGAKIQWSGTASAVGGSADTDVAAQGLASATTLLVAQSTGTIPVVKRFKNLTAADAGTTIIGTVAGIPATAGEQFVGLDCYSIEAPITPPIVVINAAHYAYGTVWAINTPTLVTALNAVMAAVVAEFDATVALADIDALFTSYGGVLGATMNATDVTTTVAITPGTKGPNAGEYVRIGTEDCFITAVSGGNYTLTRGANSTAKATHAIADVVYNRSLYCTDNVHPSTYGYRILAGLLKTTFAAMSLTSDQLDEANGYYRVEPLTLRTGTYLTSRGARKTLLTTDQKLTGMSVVVHRPLVVSAIACEVVVPGSVGSVVRLGIAGDNGGGLVDQLIIDAGTVATANRTLSDGVTNGTATVTSATAAFTANDLNKAVTGTDIPTNSFIGIVNSATSIGLSSVQGANTPVNAAGSHTGNTLTVSCVGRLEIANFRQFLNPGVYWPSACPQGAPATNPTMRSLFDLGEGLQPPGTGDFSGDVFGSGTLKNAGTATLGSGSGATVVIPHGLSVTPAVRDVSLQFGVAWAAAMQWHVTTDATNITVTTDVAGAGGSITFGWKVDCTQSTADLGKTGWTGTGVSGAFPAGIVAATAGEAILVALKIETVEPV